MVGKGWREVVLEFLPWPDLAHSDCLSDLACGHPSSSSNEAPDYLAEQVFERFSYWHHSPFNACMYSDVQNIPTEPLRCGYTLWSLWINNNSYRGPGLLKGNLKGRETLVNMDSVCNIGWVAKGR